LLGVRRERPAANYRIGNQCDELPPSHYNPPMKETAATIAALSWRAMPGSRSLRADSEASVAGRLASLCAPYFSRQW
jgi:hypothetical protein